MGYGQDLLNKASKATGITKASDVLAPGTRGVDAARWWGGNVAKARGGDGGGTIEVDADVRPTGNSAMQDMIYSQPNYEDTVYGEGGYDPGKFQYSREDYDPSQIQGYDPTKLGGVGYEVGGYDVAQRGGLEGYDPTKVEAMNFDPYRRNNLQDVSAASASGQASAEGAMARSGGLSSSDRMAMASQFNRDKIAGRSQVLGQSDELEAGNIFQVGMENARSQTGADRYLAEQGNLGRFTDQRMQTDANRYGSDAQNRAAEINAAAQTTADQRRGEARDQLMMQNVQDRNAYNRADAERRYGEAGDLYGGRRDDWATKGQIMSGNPGLDYGPRPSAPPSSSPARGIWDQPRDPAAGTRTLGRNRDRSRRA